MSTFDENTEHEDRPEFDDNGEPIIYIEEDVIPDEFASEYDGVIDLDVQDDSFYETVWGGNASSVATLAADDSTTGEEVTDPLEVEVQQDTKDTTENDGILEQANEDYNNAVDTLIDILTQALAQGEITEEMNANIQDAQGTKTKNEQIIKEICNVQEDNSILKQLADIKANMVAASVDDILDILTQGGTKPWLYKDSDNNVLVDGQSIPEVTMLVNKLNLIATDGEDESQLQLTPEFINLISTGDITLTAEHINLNGYINEGGNWSVDNEGNMRAENLKIEGDVATDTLSVNYIDNPCYPATLAGSVHLYVNANTGNDDYTIDDILQSYDEAEEQNNDSLKKKFKTIQGAIDAMPKFLNNKTVHITMETNSTEDVFIRGAVSGAIRIYMNGKTLYGTIKSYVCSATITVYGGTKDNTEGATGIIHPNTGLSFGSRAVSVGFEASQYVALYKVKVFAPDNIPSDVTNTDKVCIAAQAGTGNVYCKNVQIVNAVVGFKTNTGGRIHVNSSSGIASKYGFQALTGGIISLDNNNQCGGNTANTNKSTGGQIWYDDGKPTFATGNQTIDSGSAPSTSTTKTMTIKSTYGDTYRSSVYNKWKKDGTVRQGDYGYGDCTGCWFFGTAFTELKGKTISKVQITITRNSGGISVPVEHKLWMHKYTSRPSGAPTLTSGWSQTFRLAIGNSTTVAITNSTVLNAISAGTCKGFALRHTYDSAHYSVCSGNVTVKITYTE